MIINHPLLGPRNSHEFTYYGDASLMNRPNVTLDVTLGATADDAQEKFYNYVYLRDNPAGEHKELWYHEHGDRSWLLVTRDTVTHDIINVELAHDAN